MPLLKYAHLYCGLDLPPAAQTLTRFLSAYFDPYFEWTDGTRQIEPIVNVRVHLGDPPETAPDFLSGIHIPIDNSQGFLHCEGDVTESDLSRWVRLQPYGATIRINRAEKLIDVWGPSEAALRIPVLRVVEDVTLNQLQLEGAIVLHASAAVVDGKAVLAIGHKGSGKTTFLTRFLHGFCSTKLANDNVCLVLQDGKVFVYGWPAFFKIELGTISSLAELGVYFPAEKIPLLADPDSLWKDKQKVPLYPRQGAESFDTSVTPKAPLGALLFPTFSKENAPQVSRFHLRERGWLHQFLQGVYNPNHPDWLGYNPVDNAIVEESLDRFISSLDDTVPTYKITWSPSVDDLLASIPLIRSSKKSLRACMKESAREEDWPELPDHTRPNWSGEALEGKTVERSYSSIPETNKDGLKQYIDQEINNLAIAVNAAFKGLLAYQGASGQIAARTEQVQVELEPRAGYNPLVASIGAALRELNLEDGDVVVVPDKPFAIAQDRLIPLGLLLASDPKKTDAEGREKLLQQVRLLVSTPVDASDLILADTYVDAELGPLATVGAFDHNLIAAHLSKSIRETTGKTVDVVVSDTDTGLDVSEHLIGCVTICATPLGATRGLTIYEAMRAACAAEFARGSTRRIPIVICKPIRRSRLRPNIGEFRGYSGKLHLAREGKVAFA